MTSGTQQGRDETNLWFTKETETDPPWDELLAGGAGVGDWMFSTPEIAEWALEVERQVARFERQVIKRAFSGEQKSGFDQELEPCNRSDIHLLGLVGGISLRDNLSRARLPTGVT